MKKSIVPILGAVALTMQSCFLASLVTSTPTVVVKEQPTTTVVVQQPPVQTVVTQHNTTTVVTAPQTVNVAMYLDLNAVAAAFAQASSIRQFEQIINSSAYMINNLDLNRDGYIDYLRVLEQPYKGGVHTFLLQACVGMNTYTDVATITSNGRDYVRVTGAVGIYGANYYVQPAYTHTPAIYGCLCQSNYAVWSSPYGYNNYPSYYSRPQCYELSHYQAYCETYVSNNKYMREEKPESKPASQTGTQSKPKIDQTAPVTQKNTGTSVSATQAQHSTGHGVTTTTSTGGNRSNATKTTTTTTASKSTATTGSSSTTGNRTAATTNTGTRTTTTNVRSNGRVNTTVSTVTPHSDGTQTVQRTRTTSSSNGSTTTTTTSTSTTSTSSSRTGATHGTTTSSRSR